MRSITVSLIFISAISVAVFADIPKPDKASKQKGSIDSLLSIRLKSDAKEARLIIPKSQLLQLRAQLDQIGDPNDTAAAVSTGGAFTKTPTIVGGLFLSLAIVFGGIWFARSGKVSTKTTSVIVLFAIVAAAGTAATLVYGNAGPPPEARSITGKMFSQAVHVYGFGSGKIKLETSDDPNQPLELIVPDPKDTPKPDE